MRKMIKQFRMRRRRTEFSKIIRRAHDALAEMMLPDSIYHHARGHRIVGTRDPFGQLQPPASVRDWFAFITGEQSRKASRHNRPKPIVTSANMNVRIVNPLMNAGRNA